MAARVAAFVFVAGMLALVAIVFVSTRPAPACFAPVVPSFEHIDEDDGHSFALASLEVSSRDRRRGERSIERRFHDHASERILEDALRPSPVFSTTPRDTRTPKERREREAAWIARCSPTVVIGADGIGRYRYAAAGCEYGD